MFPICYKVEKTPVCVELVWYEKYFVSHYYYTGDPTRRRLAYNFVTKCVAEALKSAMVVRNLIWVGDRVLVSDFLSGFSVTIQETNSKDVTSVREELINLACRIPHEFLERIAGRVQSRLRADVLIRLSEQQLVVPLKTRQQPDRLVLLFDDRLIQFVCQDQGISKRVVRPEYQNVIAQITSNKRVYINSTTSVGELFWLLFLARFVPDYVIEERYVGTYCSILKHLITTKQVDQFEKDCLKVFEQYRISRLQQRNHE